jgi:hypothetical protein
MRYLQSIAKPLTVWAASSSVGPFDLPVNPLSLLLLRFQLTNVAPAALLTYSAIDALLDNITSVIVKYKGENIMQGSLRDLVVAGMLMGKRFPGWDRLTNVSGAIRSVTIPLGFGRREFDPLEAFPATSRGNLTIEMIRGADDAAWSALAFSIEAVELIEADPKQYLKITTQAMVSVVGQYDLPLPIGNPLLGLVCFDTALATLGTATSSWGVIKLLVDNVEQYFPSSDVQTLAGMLNLWAGHFIESYPGHTHQINDGAALSQSDDAHVPISSGVRGYFALNFDPLGGNEYMLETAGHADIKLRALATAASAVRCLPVELVTVKA